MYLCKLTATGCNLTDQNEKSSLKIKLVKVGGRISKTTNEKNTFSEQLQYISGKSITRNLKDANCCSTIHTTQGAYYTTEYVRRK